MAPCHCTQEAMLYVWAKAYNNMAYIMTLILYLDNVKKTNRFALNCSYFPTYKQDNPLSYEKLEILYSSHFHINLQP